MTQAQILYRDGGTLNSLHGVSQHLINKLQGAGIQSISDLAATTTSELLEDYYSNYDESVKGIDENTISQLIIKAKNPLTSNIMTLFLLVFSAKKWQKKDGFHK